MARPFDAHAFAFFIALATSTSACADLTRPPVRRGRAPATRAVAQALAAQEPAPPSQAADPSPGAAGAAGEAPADPGQIGASHILVAYQGATRAKPTVTRTKEEARQLATQLRSRALQKAGDFARLAREASDGPSGIEGGALPKFQRQQMVKPFSDAAFALKPGEVSDVVETNFGFHIIKRTE